MGCRCGGARQRGHELLEHARQQASRLYDDLIGTFTRNGAVDEETQKNDLNIVRQVTNSNETLPNARAYDFSFALEADQQLNKTGWKP